MPKKKIYQDAIKDIFKDLNNIDVIFDNALNLIPEEENKSDSSFINPILSNTDSAVAQSMLNKIMTLQYLGGTDEEIDRCTEYLADYIKTIKPGDEFRDDAEVSIIPDKDRNTYSITFSGTKNDRLSLLIKLITSYISTLESQKEINSLLNILELIKLTYLY